MYTKKKKIVITVAVIVILVITAVYFSIGGILVNAKRLGEISGYYTGINLRTVTFLIITVVTTL